MNKVVIVLRPLEIELPDDYKASETLWLDLQEKVIQHLDICKKEGKVSACIQAVRELNKPLA